MSALVHKQTDGTQKRCEFAGRPLKIGRLADSEIQVRDTFISRVHAEINFVNNAFVLKDLSSTNGTYRNGARVYECSLASGDRIQVGNATLLFEIDATTGDGLLRQVPAAVPGPRQVVVPAAVAMDDGQRPSDIKVTMPVPIMPPPAKP